MKPKISIVIRTKNEERWILKCLEQINKQTFRDFEIILVDNNSTDKTVQKATIAGVKKIFVIKNFLPGKALNLGIKKSLGEYIVCLSAHCIPTNKDWLKNLIKNFKLESNVAGVYGRQEPMEFSSDNDKRDLYLLFGLDKKIQINDSFFHNANSIIRKDIWKKIPFDNKITNIEDRLWAEKIIKQKYNIVYEPKASVFHFHGIHQNNKIDRLNNVVKLMEQLKLINNKSQNLLYSTKNFKTCCIIPIQSSDFNISIGKKLLNKTINDAKNSRSIDKVYTVTDAIEIFNYSKKNGINSILRPKYMSSNKYRVDDVCSYALKKIEKKIFSPDIIVILEIFYPFRPKKIIDLLINKLIKENLDTVLVGNSEYGISWKKNNDKFERIDNFNINKTLRNPIYNAKIGFASASFTDVIRRGNRVGSVVGLHQVNDEFTMIEIKNTKNYKNLKSKIESFK